MAAPVLKASRPVAEPSPEGQCSVLARASRYSTRQQVASLLEADPTNAVTLPMQLKVLQSLYTPASESFYVEQFYEDLQDLLELTPKKDILFIMGTRMQK